MTAKEIIIDGVDVNECNDYIRGECTAKYYLENGYEIRNFFDCEKLPNCYYKQLQRKIAECGELKKALDEVEEYCNKFGQNSIGFKKNILDIISRVKEGVK